MVETVETPLGPVKVQLGEEILNCPPHYAEDRVKYIDTNVPLEECEPEDMVNHPPHYTKGGIECIDAIAASMTIDEFRAFLQGQVMKYVWRWKFKNGKEDLEKAEFYLKKLIGTM